MPQRRGSALTLHCALPTAPGTWGLHSTRGITITDPHQPLSPFAAILAPVPPTPPSGSEAPRGPHPGTGHRNRTIFSPGQAEALEKGARAGADGGPRRQRPRGLRAEAESWRLWMPLRRGVGQFRAGTGGEWGLAPLPAPLLCEPPSLQSSSVGSTLTQWPAGSWLLPPLCLKTR